MLFLYSRVREYDQTTPVLIDSKDTDVVVMCAYAASIINGKLAIRRKRNNFKAKELCSKEMPKIIVSLHVMTGCVVTSSFLVLAKQLRENKSKKLQKLKGF